MEWTDRWVDERTRPAMGKWLPFWKMDMVVRTVRRAAAVRPIGEVVKAVRRERSDGAAVAQVVLSIVDGKVWCCSGTAVVLNGGAVEGLSGMVVDPCGWSKSAMHESY